MLFSCLRLATESKLHPDEYCVPKNEFVETLAFVMQHHPEGQEVLEIQPYYLGATRQHGFLADFHFRLGNEQAFNRRVQQLSLSLDRNFRRNLDYYLDRSTKITQFLQKRWAVLSTIVLPGNDQPLAIRKEFVALPAERLQSKVYVFSSGKESKSQFTGLRDHGPLLALSNPPRLLFAFRKQDIEVARRLAIALRGARDKITYNFPGFAALFKVDLDIDSNPFVLPDLSEGSMQAALDRAKCERARSPTILPVLILPDSDDNGYLEQKALFSNSEIPTQVCTTPILENPESLKWAVANIALQIFCKAGGQPWKVRPTTDRTLIIGISQSHKFRIDADKSAVERYFAFSVLTDSSGLFQKIQVLGEDTEPAGYLEKLRTTLRQVLAQSAATYRKVVIHTSFKLKHDEMDAIQETVRGAAIDNASTCTFAVLKVNSKNRFFGTNRLVNSLVPYEATKVRLGHNEYLLWFEGIFPDKPTVTKAFPGPTHVQVLRVTDEDTSPSEQRELLQDLVNLSGANWRGFNAKSSPVSVFYCHLVADLKHFQVEMERNP